MTVGANGRAETAVTSRENHLFARQRSSSSDPRSWVDPQEAVELCRNRSHPAERVDQACRFFFPFGFFVCNFFYWLYYLEI